MAVANGRNQFLRRAGVIGVIGLGMARRGDSARMMEIVVQNAVGSPATLVDRQHLMPAVQFVFAVDDDRSVARRLPSRARQLSDNVFVGVVDDGLSRIEPQPVDVKLAHPIGGVVGNEIAHWTRTWPVEIDRVAPFGVVLLRKIIGRKLRGIIAARSEVVVNGVENHSHAQRVGAIDERPHVVGRAVELRRSKPVARRRIPSQIHQETPRPASPAIA